MVRRRTRAIFPAALLAAAVAALTSILSASVASALTPFVSETVDSTYSVGSYCSLALDAQGNPRASYYDASSGHLRYASKNNGAWSLETVDFSSGLYTSIALDSQGNPHISYYDNFNADLEYASK